ncbi:hypothetical protein NUACC21_44270 [Scytonema sp. NUACC21]
MSINTLEQPSANYLEQLLQRAATDAEFRNELESNPTSFGISSETTLVLPKSVAIQEQSGMELGDDVEGELGIVVACQSTCTSGPYTIICDGTTK